MFSSLALLLAAVLAVSAQNVWSPTAATLLIGDAQTGVYDDATAWDNGAHCSGSLKVGTKNLGDYLKQNFAGIRSVGGYNCRQNTNTRAKMSVHGTGRAIDVMIPVVAGDANNAVGDPIAKYLVENAQRLGVQYFIWCRKSWSLSRPAGQKFNTYTGPNPHIDHLHVELTIAAASRVGSPPPAASDPQCVAKAGTCLETRVSTCWGGGTFLSLCPTFGTAFKCCVPPPSPAACNAECAKRTGCTGTIQSVVGKSTCVCTCPTTTRQMCGSSSVAGGVTKSPCVVPSPGGVCDANGKCKTSATNTALSKTCVPC